MAEGARPTLKLKPPAAKAAPAPAVVPVYDRNKAGELRGGVGLVQEDNVFHPERLVFMRKLPKEQGYYLTPEQQQNFNRQMAKQRAALSPLSRQADPPPLPEKLVQIQRENAQAAAVELLAE